MRLSHAALPADPETVAAFIAHDANKSSPATLRRRLAGIRKVHRLLRLENPVDDEDVAIAMRRALRTKPRRQKQALGLTRALARPTHRGVPRHPARQTRSSPYRRRIRHAVPARRIGLAAKRKIFRRSKTAPCRSWSGARRTIHSATAATGSLTPPTMQFLLDWLDAAEIKEGFLFRRITGDWIGPGALHPYSVNRILKEAAKKAGLAPKVVADLSGHSMRVGAAQDLMADGLGILPIMQAGGWKSIECSRPIRRARRDWTSCEVTKILKRPCVSTRIGMLGKLRSRVGAGAKMRRSAGARTRQRGWREGRRADTLLVRRQSWAGLSAGVSALARPERRLL